MRASLVPLLVCLTVVPLGCGDSGTNPPPPPSGGYDAPATREMVLQNLQRSYNERNVTEYTKILDDGFVFFLSDGDVNGGLPSQWGRDVETDANTHLFSEIEDPMGRWPLCTAIQMDVVFENGVTWTPVPNPAAAPDETWYTTTCFYDFQIAIAPDIRFIPTPGSQAQFTVRNAGTETKPSWRLVDMRDLGGAVLAGKHAFASESATWGSVKALFR